MSSIALEMALILLLIVANGMFSGSEIVVVSAGKVRLEQLVEQGDRPGFPRQQPAKGQRQPPSTSPIGGYGWPPSR